MTWLAILGRHHGQLADLHHAWATHTANKLENVRVSEQASPPVSVRWLKGGQPRLSAK